MSRVERSGEAGPQRLNRLVQRGRTHLVALREGALRYESVSGSMASAEIEALLFNWERFAWTIVAMAELLVFESRLSPGSFQQSSKLLDTLVREAELPLGDGRRLKQLLEYRLLSQREPEGLSIPQILSSEGILGAEELFESWVQFAKKTLS